MISTYIALGVFIFAGIGLIVLTYVRSRADISSMGIDKKSKDKSDNK